MPRINLLTYPGDLEPMRANREVTDHRRVEPILKGFNTRSNCLTEAAPDSLYPPQVL